MPPHAKKSSAEETRPLPKFDFEQPQVGFLDTLSVEENIPSLLFTGPAGAGKEYTAIDFARKLNCTAESTCSLDAPACDSCLKASLLEHPGIHMIYPTPTQGSAEGEDGDVTDISRILEEKRRDIFATHRFSKRTSVRVARARAVIQRANTKPFDARFNVFIFVDAHAMREEAQNALLKLVEEPLPHSRLIFLTTNPDGILYTIRSRCQRVRFLPLKLSVVTKFLMFYYGANEEVAGRAAALAQGSVARGRDLVESFDDSERQAAAGFVKGITQSPESWAIGSALTVARGSNRESVAHFLDDVARVFRDVMAGEKSLYINGDMAPALDKLGKQWPKEALPGVINRIADARTQILFANTNVDSTLTELFLDISRARK